MHGPKYSMVIYIGLNSTPNIDCYWVGAVPKVYRTTTESQVSGV